MTEFERRHEIRQDGWPQWLLVGPRGTVQFVAMRLPDMTGSPSLGAVVDGVRLMGADIGYHSPVPRRAGQEPMSQCPLYGDGECYYGGTSLGADELLKMWAEAGCNDEIIWTSLEARYEEWLNGDPDEELFVSPLEAFMEALRRGEDED